MSESNKTGDTFSSSNFIHDKFVNLKREAFSNLNKALGLDQSSKDRNEAILADQLILAYEKSLDLVSNALKLHESNILLLSQFDDVTNYVNQLKSIKTQTQDRLDTLKSQRLNAANKNISAALYPSLKKVKSIEELDQDEFLNMGDRVLLDDDCVIIEDESASSLPSNSPLKNMLNDFSRATEFLRFDNGVQLFYIANDGTVSTPSYPTTLSFYSFDNEEKSNSEQKPIVGFIRVGSWLYPLTPNESPAMKTDFNGYIFPNKDTETLTDKNGKMNCFVGITFNSEISSEQKAVFEDVLLSYNCLVFQDQSRNTADNKQRQVNPSLSGSVLNNQEVEVVTDDDENWDESKSRKQDDEPKLKPSNTSEYIGRNLINCAQYISDGVQKGSAIANNYINDQSEKIRSQMQPNSRPVEIDPKLRKAAQTLRYGTHVSVRVSTFLLNKLGSFATYTAKTVAPHLKQGTSALLCKTGLASNKENASGYVDNICNVTHSGVQSFAIVYDSLEQAARVLGKNITDKTVVVVEHKYGPDAANLTLNGMYSVGNIAQSVNNVRNLKVIRTVVKTTAKEAIKSGRNQNVDSKESINKSNEKIDKIE